MSVFSQTDRRHMSRALELARQGQGHVEPNPMVGCVIARGDIVVAEGYHEQFGSLHAERAALQKFAKQRADDATLYVTLEPCCHYGKTPPCTDAILAARIPRVVVAADDPFSHVNGGGYRTLRDAGVVVETGLLADEAHYLNAPYEKLLRENRPWVIAKWAMTLDGKIASRTGDSQWISNERSREVAHRLRGRVDAIMVGRRTAEIDDPLLTARPSAIRTASRIVVDSRAQIDLQSRLIRTAPETPVIIVVGPDASAHKCQQLATAGCEVLTCEATDADDRIGQLLDGLGRRQMTNVLVEGGSQLLGTLFDQQLVDEVHVFIAPKIVGGAGATTAVAGHGIGNIGEALTWDLPVMETLDGDVYLTGRVRRSTAT